MVGARRHAVAEVDLGTDVMEVWVPVLTAV
jgi:hypothetical protein